jgi:hypothetical protein
MAMPKLRTKIANSFLSPATDVPCSESRLKISDYARCLPRFHLKKLNSFQRLKRQIGFDLE